MGYKRNMKFYERVVTSFQLREGIFVGYACFVFQRAAAPNQLISLFVCFCRIKSSTTLFYIL